MDWIKDKKNQPIVYAVSGVILVASIVFLLFQFGVIGGSGGGSVPPPPSALSKGAPIVPGGPPIPGRPPGAPPIPGGPSVAVAPLIPGSPAGSRAPVPPGAVPAAAGAVKQAAATPRKGGTSDPFKAPVNALPATLQTKPLSVASFLPYVYIARTQPRESATQGRGKVSPTDIGPPEVSTTQRMSGVLFTDKGIVGLLETNGQSQQVYPGDTVNDGSARVISIQSDGLILRRTNDNHLVRVPLSGVSTGPAASPDNPAPSPPDNGNNGGVNNGNTDTNTDNL